MEILRTSKGEQNKTNNSRKKLIPCGYKNKPSGSCIKRFDTTRTTGLRFMVEWTKIPTINRKQTIRHRIGRKNENNNNSSRSSLLKRCSKIVSQKNLN